MNWLPYPFTNEQWNAPGIKLHLGCGNIYLNDFVNIDLDNLPILSEDTKQNILNSIQMSLQDLSNEIIK